jgi:hypothetical protein
VETSVQRGSMTIKKLSPFYPPLTRSRDRLCGSRVQLKLDLGSSTLGQPTQHSDEHAHRRLSEDGEYHPGHRRFRTPQPTRTPIYDAAVIRRHSTPKTGGGMWNAISWTEASRPLPFESHLTHPKRTPERPARNRSLATSRVTSPQRPCASTPLPHRATERLRVHLRQAQVFSGLAGGSRDEAVSVGKKARHHTTQPTAFRVNANSFDGGTSHVSVR